MLAINIFRGRRGDLAKIPLARRHRALFTPNDWTTESLSGRRRQAARCRSRRRRWRTCSEALRNVSGELTIPVGAGPGPGSAPSALRTIVPCNQARGVGRQLFAILRSRISQWEEPAFNPQSTRRTQPLCRAGDELSRALACAADGAGDALKRNSEPSRHMACMITASLRATATQARL